MPGPTVRLNLPSRNTTARSYCAAMRRLKMTNRMNRMTATIRMVVANGLPMAASCGMRPRLQVKWRMAGPPVLRRAHGSHVPGRIDRRRSVQVSAARILAHTRGVPQTAGAIGAMLVA